MNINTPTQSEYHVLMKTDPMRSRDNESSGFRITDVISLLSNFELKYS